ncbi:MAG: undecaprenyl-diphosphate phosphatase [Spirochaetes bacterium]|jgi:undecaprenyl-diphosphatase|nr:undecaprenyl-diphosphate phosphatase [Spirochaetota bacterium]
MKNLFVTFLALGIVQGVAEFLPISSSGHLVLMQNIPWFNQSINAVASNKTLFINVALHLASLAAVLIYFRKDIYTLATESILALIRRDFRNGSLLIAIYIVLASIPAAIFGIMFHSFIETRLSSLLPVSIMLILNGLVLLYTKRISSSDRQLEEMGFITALMIGCCQAVAVIPGISRAGMTISGGMILGIEPEKAARFSFLMSIPVIAGAGLLETGKVASQGLGSSFYIPLLAGAFVCFVVALLSLSLLFVIIKKTGLSVFGFYTIAAGLCGVTVHLLV